MVLNKEDRILIKNLYYFKSYGAKRLIGAFPTKGWKKTTVNDFLKRLKEIGSTTRKSGSRRPRTVQTVANISAVNDLVLSVVRIIRDELRLKCVKTRHDRSWLRPTASPVWVARRSCQFHLLYISEGIYSCTTCQPPERLCLRAM